MTPIRNDPGRFRIPHANVLGQLAPNKLPTGNKAEIRSHIDLIKEVLHHGTDEVSMECMREMSVVDSPVDTLPSAPSPPPPMGMLPSAPLGMLPFACHRTEHFQMWRP